MKRNMLFGAGAAALACLLGGCQLAVPQGAAGQDTLIGGYATWESIPYFSEHFLSGDRSPARLYADWSSADRPDGAQWRNIFPNVTGYALCQNTAEEDGDTVYLGSGADPYFSGLAYNSAYNGSETTESMTGTLYADISQIRGDITGFTFSPVYQTADGQIYLAEGQRVTCSTQNLEDSSLSLSVSAAQTESSSWDGTSKTEQGFTAKLSFLYAAQAVRVLQMDTDYGVLGQADYPAAAVPEELKFLPGAEFILLESRSTDTAGAGHTARQIIGRDELEDYGADGQMKYVTLYLRGDGPLAEVHAIALKG